MTKMQHGSIALSLTEVPRFGVAQPIDNAGVNPALICEMMSSHCSLSAGSSRDLEYLDRKPMRSWRDLVVERHSLSFVNPDKK